MGSWTSKVGAVLGLAALLGTSSAVAATPAGKAELLFTDRSDNVAETNISPEEQRLLNLIDLETVAIKASIDGLGRGNVVDRLIAAHRRGVVVQVTADCQIVVADANPLYKQMMDAGIPVVDDNNTYDGPTVDPGCTSRETSGFVHNKFFIFKGQQTVWTGSTNMTDYAFNSAQNAILILSGNPEVVGFYEAEFNHMFGNGLSLRSGGTGKFGQQKTLKPGIGQFTLADGTAVEVAFSPYNYTTTPDTLAQLNRTIDGATSELLWTVYQFTYDDVRLKLDGNLSASKRGIVDPSATTNSDDTSLLISGGEKVLVTNFLGANHWKLIISNPNASGGQVLVGSHNFTSSSFNYNNENSVRLLSPTLAGTAKAEFDVVWSDPQNTGLVGCIHSAESYNENSKALHRCNDAYDNDYDGKSDSADADCSKPFVCGASTCKASGATCSTGAECCSGTCYNGKTKYCK